MSIKLIRSGYERGKYKPVQAYVDRGVLARFNIKYQNHGDITKLIRNAFVIAISEDDATERAAGHQVTTQLGEAPPTTTIEIPCEDCVYRVSCLKDNQCVINELNRQINAVNQGVDILR